MANRGGDESDQRLNAAAPSALSTAYDAAIHFARILHASQTRKSTGAPYLSHLVEVSGLVLEYGGDEDQAVAALLHDAIEDQADAFGGADKLRSAIASSFGMKVLHLVEICSDCESKPKPDWLPRKQAHVAHLAAATAYECLVPAADKLHNLRGINSDLRAGKDPFLLFKAGAADQLWYFSSMAAVFEGKRLPIARDLRFEVQQLRSLVTEHMMTREQQLQQQESEEFCMP